MKAYFFQRFAAYIVDIILVSFVMTLIMLPFPENQNLTKLNEEQTTINNAYLSGKMDVSEYMNKSTDVGYDIAYESVIYTIVDLCAIILYFMVFQFYNKGQTVGKKLMKIKVVKNDGGELSMNDLIYRSLLIHSVFVNLVILALTLFSTKQIYFYGCNILQVLQGVFMIVCAFMVMYRKDGRGLHDLVAGTKVVSTREKEMVTCEN